MNLIIYLHANKSNICVVIDRDKFDVPGSKQDILFWAVILRDQKMDVSSKHNHITNFIFQKKMDH